MYVGSMLVGNYVGAHYLTTYLLYLHTYICVCVAVYIVTPHLIPARLMSLPLELVPFAGSRFGFILRYVKTCLVGIPR